MMLTTKSDISLNKMSTVLSDNENKLDVSAKLCLKALTTSLSGETKLALPGQRWHRLLFVFI